jgi:hypothetical protein
MGFLNNTTVTVDAILTKKGRELLAQGTEAFNITKFALADDEIDYGLWDVTHPNGSDYYGAVIENMPLLEATPDENHIMRYKLVTLPKNTIKMPLMTVTPPDGITFDAAGPHIARDVKAETSNVPDHSYTFILHDQSIVTMIGGEVQSQSPFSDEASNSLTVRAASQVTIEVGSGVSAVAKTQLTIIGNDTGATKSITITNNYVV